ncbi:conserved hypothetical protein [Chloroherpeton thalassium ATCC 35110]|uniref:DUF4295 domain-containing protein n=1 Tax=Chloroherpeton thalassium (strain ATCC 35110 / GB-78) TaxID=517418 RepID=B3QX36_CHLT3|nr:hypothetical protein [Chloroherpeton thalassium]ACF14846.1 conserved hypothetical protein [Chloroherpeton thalassium ATCC 35110]
MAKQQTFGDKAKKKKETATKTIKLVYSTRSEKTGGWRFAEKYVTLPKDQDENAALAEAMK